MKMTIPARWYRPSRASPLDALEVLLLGGVALAAVGVFWALVKPLGPIGTWRSSDGGMIATDLSLLTRIDPFFRNAISGPATVTSLPLKLFGVRVDQAGGRGSAIVATPDGIQSSYVVGDEMMPGVRLKSVAFDSVTIERGGASEQLFLDQSVVAPVAAPAPLGSTPMLLPSSTQSLADSIAFAPRVDNGVVTGFVVNPKGPGSGFATAGLQPGDVVTSINGTLIRSSEDAMRAMRAIPDTGRASFIVDRGGRTMAVTTGSAK